MCGHVSDLIVVWVHIGMKAILSLCGMHMGLTAIVSLCRCVWAETAIASLYWCVQEERSYRCAGMCIGIDRIDIGVYSHTTRFPAYRIACCSTHLLPTTHKMKTSKDICICKSLSKQQKKQIAFIIAVIFHVHSKSFFNSRPAPAQIEVFQFEDSNVARSGFALCLSLLQMSI